MRLLLAALTLIVVSGCDKFDPFGEVKARVAGQLKDPDSAKFRDLERIGKAVCGEVNAKNSYGGYIGYQRFYADDDEVLFGSGGNDLDAAVKNAEVAMKCLDATTAELEAAMGDLKKK